MATGQRKRDKKVSKGTARGARKTGPLDPITLILLGKGRMDSRYPLGKPVFVSTSDSYEKPRKSPFNGTAVPNAALAELKSKLTSL